MPMPTWGLSAVAGQFGGSFVFSAEGTGMSRGIGMWANGAQRVAGLGFVPESIVSVKPFGVWPAYGVLSAAASASGFMSPPAARIKSNSDDVEGEVPFNDAPRSK